VIEMVKTTKKAIDEFKAFVKKYPKLSKVRRENNLSWQDLFEEWVLYGEDKTFWNEYGIKIKAAKSEKKLFDFGGGSGADILKVVNFLNQLNPEDFQEKLKQVDSALSTIQGLIGQFGSGSSQSASNTGGNMNPTGQMNGPYSPFGPGPNYNYYNRD
jgi:hypothetical protein